MASLGMVLEQYSDVVVVYVTDPRTGIQRRSKWPPTISEIVDACEQHLAYIDKVTKFKNWGKQDEPLAIEAPREARPSMDDMRDRYGKNWGMKSLDEPERPAQPAPTWDEITVMYQAEPSRLAALLATDGASSET